MLTCHLEEPAGDGSFLVTCLMMSGAELVSVRAPRNAGVALFAALRSQLAPCLVGEDHQIVQVTLVSGSGEFLDKGWLHSSDGIRPSCRAAAENLSALKGVREAYKHAEATAPWRHTEWLHAFLDDLLELEVELLDHGRYNDDERGGILHPLAHEPHAIAVEVLAKQAGLFRQWSDWIQEASTAFQAGALGESEWEQLCRRAASTKLSGLEPQIVKRIPLGKEEKRALGILSALHSFIQQGLVECGLSFSSMVVVSAS